MHQIRILCKLSFLDLNATFSSALNIGHKNDWTVLEPAAERCLQSLVKLDTDQVRAIGEVVKLKRVYGAVLELRKMVKDTKESDLEFDLFSEDLNDKPPFLLVEEEDYLDIDRGSWITWEDEMLINSLDIILEGSWEEVSRRVKSHDPGEYSHFPQKHDLGTDLPYGREFSLCERAGSKVDNDTKNISDILKVLKTLRDMHKALVKAIIIEG
ncbi:1388_t:CDS:2, partial [Ambispora gerdemannii]